MGMGFAVFGGVPYICRKIAKGMKKQGMILLWMVLLLLQGFVGRADVDGPYVLYDSVGRMHVVRVDDGGRVLDSVYAGAAEGQSLYVASQDGRHRFRVRLRAPRRPAWETPQAERTLVISDPHGDLDCLVSVLRNNGVIGADYEWTFGRNQLVVIGDVFDRGDDVVPIFWLLYKLEQEAEAAGGIATFLLGNHEEMVLRGNLKYARGKYIRLADSLGMDYSGLWHGNSELGRWLQTRNVMQKAGGNLFVHAGLSGAFCAQEAAIPDINAEVGRTLFLSKEERKAFSSLSSAIYNSSSGVLWYRGMVRSEDRYRPVYAEETGRILEQYGVERVFVGHTIFSEPTSFFGRKVIAVNVDNRENREKSRSRGMLLEGDELYWIYDDCPPKIYPY